MYIFTHSRAPKVAQNPYFHTWIDAAGNKKLYTREDVEKLAPLLPKHTAKRVLHMKAGSTLNISHLASNNDLLLTRLRDDEMLELNGWTNIKDQIKTVKQEIERLAPDLHKQLKELETRCRAVEKSSKWEL